MLIMSLHAINFPLELLNFTQPLGPIPCPIPSALHKSYSIVGGSSIGAGRTEVGSYLVGELGGGNRLHLPSPESPT